MQSTRLVLPMLLLATTLCGCQTAYYKTMEKFGYQKRDILVDRIKDARDEQAEAKEQFADALEQFRSVVNVKGGDLEVKYRTLKGELDDSEARAKAVHDRIDAVESVSDDLFREWEAELRQYSDDALRRESRRKLEQTRARYEQLIGAMKRAESKIEPVLKPLRDQVLFLKHNLNAQAIASLQGELATMDADVSALIRDMEKSIAEADAFIRTMKE